MPSIRTLMVIVLTIPGVSLLTPQPASASASSAVASAGAGAGSAATATAAASRSSGLPATATYEREVLRLTNLARKRHGLRPLTPIACSNRTANRWARVMGSRDMFRHQPRRRLVRACRTQYIGENIVMGRPLTAAFAVRLWMDSKGHRANILNPKFRHLGVGAYTSLRTGRTYVVQNFRR